MVETFRKFWPESVNLVVYGDYEYEPMAGVEWRAMPEWHKAFKQRHAATPDAHGAATGKYNYRRDCVRFSHKVAALTDAAQRPRDGVLIWIDADTFTDRDVSLEVLARWLPHGYAMSWLDRQCTYPECGFMMFRNGQRLFDALRNVYESDYVFKYQETHDSYVIMCLVRSLLIKPFNLSGPTSTRSHPWCGSELAKYMDHLKGKRKLFGKSGERNV
jgi:hypothetical protein